MCIFLLPLRYTYSAKLITLDLNIITIFLKYKASTLQFIPVPYYLLPLRSNNVFVSILFSKALSLFAL